MANTANIMDTVESALKLFDKVMDLRTLDYPMTSLMNI
jgi:hypothetical protein